MRYGEWTTAKVVGEETASLMKARRAWGARGRWLWIVTAPEGRGTTTLRVDLGATRTKLGAMIRSARVLGGWAREDRDG